MSFIYSLKYYIFHPFSAFVFLFGACIGSFLNVCIYRIPKGNFWKSSRSYCPHCKSPIAFFDNIPIVSFLILRAKARCCKKPISWQYPMVELATALMAVLLYWQFPFINEITDQSQTALLSSVHPKDFIRFSHAFVFFCVLLVSSVIDLHLMIIPDILSIGLIATAPLVVWLHPELTLASSMIGILIGGGVLYLLAWIYYLVRKDIGMGFGDVKLLAGIGGWLGYQSILPTLLCGSIIGSVIGISILLVTKNKSLKTAIPFGPFLSLGAMIYLLLGQRITELFISFSDISNP